MNTLVFQFANGNVMFLGLLMTNIACVLQLRHHKRWFHSAVTIIAVIGAIFVLLSSTPLPLWVYVVWAFSFAMFIISANSWQKYICRLQPLAIGCLVIISTAMLATELPYHMKPRLSFPRDKPLFVIGDSLSIALEKNVDPWPNILEKTSGLAVTNLAVGGNTVARALKEADKIYHTDASVLLEIGGNDLLNAANPIQFEVELRNLLDRVCKPGRVVAMFELPLLPFHNRFGRLQRKYADSHGVILIPKKYMTSVFAYPGATIDGLHLSQVGHNKMASLLNEIIE